VNEGPEESDLVQSRVEAPTEPARTAPAGGLTTRGRLRLAYAFEFLLAILTVFTLWSEVGGQGHLELLPWYVKLICVLGCAWCCVRYTAAIVEQAAAWNRRSIGWLAGIVLFGIAMGGITYYYHLNEDQNDDADDTTSTASLSPRHSSLNAAATMVAVTFSGHQEDAPVPGVLFLCFE
jgi:hypothetical protein